MKRHEVHKLKLEITTVQCFSVSIKILTSVIGI